MQQPCNDKLTLINSNLITVQQRDLQLSLVEGQLEYLEYSSLNFRFVFNTQVTYVQSIFVPNFVKFL